MNALKRSVGVREGGFTLVEMTVVIAIIAVLAALTLPAVTGVTTSTRESSKIGDLKSVEQAVTRFENDNPATFPSSTQLSSLTLTESVLDDDGDGDIEINVWLTADSPDSNADIDCSGVTVAAALKKCFAAIDFSDLTPDYLKLAPNYSTESSFVTNPLVTSGSVAGDSSNFGEDFRIDNCDLAGNPCVFFLSTSADLTGELSVWNVLRAGTDIDPKVGGVLALVDDAKYGREP